MNRIYLIGGAAIALFATGYAAGSCGKATNADLEAAHDSTRAALARSEQAEDARRDVQIQAESEIATHKATADSALAFARLAASRRPTVVDRIVNREAPADTMVARRVAQAVTDSLVTNEIMPLQRVRLAQDSAFAVQGRLLAATDIARSEAQEALRRALMETQALRDARPSWLSRTAPKLAIPVAIAGGWWLRGKFGGK